MYYQTKFGSKRISSSKDSVEIVMFWSYELLKDDSAEILFQSFSRQTFSVSITSGLKVDTISDGVVMQSCLHIGNFCDLFLTVEQRLFTRRHRDD